MYVQDGNLRNSLPTESGILILPVSRTAQTLTCEELWNRFQRVASVVGR